MKLVISIPIFIGPDFNDEEEKESFEYSKSCLVPDLTIVNKTISPQTFEGNETYISNIIFFLL